jgi:hypothetical protein
MVSMKQQWQWQWQWFGAAGLVAMLTLAGCVPLAGTPGGPPANGAGGAAVSTVPGTPPGGAQPLAGARNIVVGAAPGLRVELNITPPAQVCDADAFADGVRYGYASTWNGEVGQPGALASAKKTAAGADAGATDTAAAPKAMFDPTTVQSKDQQYVIRWGNGSEPTNACATYGYQIGKIVGAHRAYVDLRAAGIS